MPAQIATKPRRWPAIFLGLVFALAGTGCDHLTDPEGPNLTDRFGDFFVVEPLEASRAEVDFAAGESVYFTALFNKQVNWTLEITGQESGAVKRIEGFSNELTAENARWNGGTTELPLFRAEPAEVILLIDEVAADTLRTTVEALSARAYNAEVVANFEEGPGPRIRVGNFEFEFDAATGRSQAVPAGEGEWFYRFGGTDNVLRNYFVGLIDILPPAAGPAYFPVPTTVPEDLYFNAFLFSFGTPHTIAVIQLIADANGNGTYEDGPDTVFSTGDIRIDWEDGWRLVSRSFAELGLTEEQAQQLVAIRVLLISDNNAQPPTPLPVAYGIDYLTFTAGGPFRP